MLTNTTTLYLVNLCDAYPDNKFVVVEWNDLKSLGNFEEGVELSEMWKELKMNVCIINKYADGEEVCFSLTDKARVLVQEYKVLMEQMAAQEKDDSEKHSLDNSYIKTDENGSLVIMPSSGEVIKKRKFELKELKKSAMGRGFLGGLLSGGIIGAIFGVLGGLIINLLM